jgi:hypothetical protein
MVLQSPSMSFLNRPLCGKLVLANEGESSFAITSQTMITMITMINENADDMELVGLGDFYFMILVFYKLDRFVEIINATRSSNNNVK